MKIVIKIRVNQCAKLKYKQKWIAIVVSGWITFHNVCIERSHCEAIDGSVNACRRVEHVFILLWMRSYPVSCLYILQVSCDNGHIQLGLNSRYDLYVAKKMKPLSVYHMTAYIQLYDSLTLSEIEFARNFPLLIKTSIIVIAHNASPWHSYFHKRNLRWLTNRVSVCVILFGCYCNLNSSSYNASCGANKGKNQNKTDYYKCEM